MSYEIARDVGESWHIWEQCIGYKRYYRVTSGNGAHIVIDSVSGGWHHVMLYATVSDFLAALYVAPESPSKGTRLESMRRIIEHGINERRWAYEKGLLNGIKRAENEKRVGESPIYARLKECAQKLMRAKAMDSECPWLVGIIPGTARRATKSVFLFPWNIDKAAHRQIIVAVEALGIPMTGNRNGLARHTSHCLVLAPTATAGTDHYVNGISLQQNEFQQVLKIACVELDQHGNFTEIQEHQNLQVAP